MTAGVCNSMSNDEGKVHTRILRLPTVDSTPVKHLNPPAVVITADDSDTMMESPRRIPVSKSLVFNDKSRKEVADFRALSAKKANGSIPARQESSENSSPEAVQLGLSPTTPNDQHPGDDGNKTPPKGGKKEIWYKRASSGVSLNITEATNKKHRVTDFSRQAQRTVIQFLSAAGGSGTDI
ncbi:hypothetical protein AVEN_107250-1 [Araneus ventricosus]|uniref:Uncharacterized protein n=1 Tax=Araneus ventricosus TaxID=182803 RepID=A0A4Y2HKB5_ARAVE|nr:hypothetical protein AVEN_107250-1 [Araneus ventricosus]